MGKSFSSSTYMPKTPVFRFPYHQGLIPPAFVRLNQAEGLDAGAEGRWRSAHTDSMGKAWGCSGPGQCREGRRKRVTFSSVHVLFSPSYLTGSLDAGQHAFSWVLEPSQGWSVSRLGATQAADPVTTCTPLQMPWTYLRHCSTCRRPLEFPYNSPSQM